MVDIAAPQPHLAPAFRCARPLARTQSLPTAVADDTFYCVPQPQPISSPPRLLSPYRVPEDAGLRKLSKPPCSPTKRRRGLARNLSRSVRHRHCARADCCINNISGPLTSLDDLPWISALSIEPDHSNPWDIADLSLLNTTIEEETYSSGPGPVRRRKTSLRKAHLAQTPMKGDQAATPLVPFPFARRALFSQSDLLPHTPPPRDQFVPSEVIFQGLHPIFPSDIDEPPRPF
ncbi:hypothetical protein L226DRAFT_191029 [Lentinus tigrinus ALCF2SS1-7]|uniref:uncharacterized protein n=1 Tax=Lentinus tigrinus ALCF2SS1-7 TaxID=1328758 RepID=UPI0011662DB5|nr:hypothetical protein L226DRAFT_191029 [Lentinus tigrinus ALCF2SS1-7]